MDRAEFEEIAKAAGIAVKGKKNPYCSINGHMFAFLQEGQLCCRFEEARRAELATGWGQGPVVSYGAVMRGYVALPEGADHRGLLAEAEAYVKTLKHK